MEWKGGARLGQWSDFTHAFAQTATTSAMIFGVLPPFVAADFIRWRC
jgi:hypothetical protein